MVTAVALKTAINKVNMGSIKGMITLITAVPGSGKTLLAVGLIVDYIAEGRHVFP